MSGPITSLQPSTKISPRYVVTSGLPASCMGSVASYPHATLAAEIFAEMFWLNIHSSIGQLASSFCCRPRPGPTRSAHIVEIVAFKKSQKYSEAC